MVRLFGQPLHVFRNTLYYSRVLYSTLMLIEQDTELALDCILYGMT